MGVVDDKRWEAFQEKEAGINALGDELKSQWVRPGNVDFERMLGKPLSREYSLLELLRRPEVEIQNLLACLLYTSPSPRD